MTWNEESLRRILGKILDVGAIAVAVVSMGIGVLINALLVPATFYDAVVNRVPGAIAFVTFIAVFLLYAYLFWRGAKLLVKRIRNAR